MSKRWNGADFRSPIHIQAESFVECRSSQQYIKAEYSSLLSLTQYYWHTKWKKEKYRKKRLRLLSVQASKNPGNTVLLWCAFVTAWPPKSSTRGWSSVKGSIEGRPRVRSSQHLNWHNTHEIKKFQTFLGAAVKQELRRISKRNLIDR